MTSDEERIFPEADSDLLEEQPEKARTATTAPADTKAPIFELNILLDVFLCVCIYLNSALRL
jgi:hypothetical protein